MADVRNVIVLEQISGTSPISHWGLNTEPQRFKDLPIPVCTSVKTKKLLENTSNRKEIILNLCKFLM